MNHSESTVLNTPEDILNFASTQAPLLRQTLGQGMAQGRFNTAEDIVMTERITVTYGAISLATEHPDYKALCHRFIFEKLELAWHLMLHIRTPGRLFPRLPSLEEPLIIPPSVLPPFNAALTLRSLH